VRYATLPVEPLPVELPPVEPLPVAGGCTGRVDPVFAAPAGSVADTYAASVAPELVSSDALPRPKVPASLRVAGGLTIAEGLALLVVAGWLGAGAARENLGHPMAAWVPVVLMVAFAVAVTLTGRGLLLAARWSRAPGVLTQLLVILTGTQLIPNPLLVAVCVAAAAIVLVMTFLRQSTAAFVADDEEREPA